MLLGCAIGAFFAGRLADRWGRRARVLIISARLFLLSALGAGSATTSTILHRRARDRRFRRRRGQRDVAGRTSPKWRQRATAAGWRRCSRSRSSAACSARS
jgi:MFS family permease